MARNGIYLARAREQIAQQRAENEREHRRRVDDAYRRVPGLRALDQTLQQQMITLVGLTMRHGSDPTDELRALERANLDTQAQRAELLTYVLDLMAALVREGRVTFTLEDIKQILFNTKEIRGTQENVLYIGVISSYWHFLYLLCERYVALSLSLHA